MQMAAPRDLGCPRPRRAVGLTPAHWDTSRVAAAAAAAAPLAYLAHYPRRSLRGGHIFLESLPLVFFERPPPPDRVLYFSYACTLRIKREGKPERAGVTLTRGVQRLDRILRQEFISTDKSQALCVLLGYR